MKAEWRCFAGLILLVVFFRAHGEVQLTETPGTWVLKKGTSNIKTGLASYEACKAEVVSRGTSTLTKYSCNVANTVSVIIKPDTGWVRLELRPPAAYVDGTPITDFTGYRIYYGQDLSALTRMVPVPTTGMAQYQVNGLAPGTWYFAVTAVTKAEQESERAPVITQVLK